jgi:hypothetical protein
MRVIQSFFPDNMSRTAGRRIMERFNRFLVRTGDEKFHHIALFGEMNPLFLLKHAKAIRSDHPDRIEISVYIGADTLFKRLLFELQRRATTSRELYRADTVEQARQIIIEKAGEKVEFLPPNADGMQIAALKQGVRGSLLESFRVYAVLYPAILVVAFVTAFFLF